MNSTLIEPQTSPSTLEQWLEYQLSLHRVPIDLTLDRQRAVAQRLGLRKPAPIVLTVGGTNGKGSTVAFLRAMLQAMGLRVGSYTSPHILHYRERIALHERFANDDEIIAAFQAIEKARGDIGLTYFEFGTLAALEIFQQSALDVVILEVGLGGRLDSVNMIDADGVILTTVDLDHQEYLGDTRSKIGIEKAGIFRWDQCAVYADDQPVPEVVELAKKLGTKLMRVKVDYRVIESAASGKPGWELKLPDGITHVFPYPKLAAPVQIKNAAAAMVLIHSLQPRLPFNVPALAYAVLHADLPGRLQKVGERPDIYFDVAHNPQAAHSLASWLHSHPIFGRNLAVFGAMADKDVIGVTRELRDYIQAWYLTGLNQEIARGMEGLRLAALVRGNTQGNYEAFADVQSALDAAIQKAKPEDRIVVFGSFFLIAAAARALKIGALEAQSIAPFVEPT